MAEVSTGSDRAIGIDIGGTGIKGASVDLAAGTFAADRIRLLTPSPATPDSVAGVVKNLLAEIDAPGPIGLTLPAVVQSGIVRTASNIDKGWIGADAVELFERVT